jgi:uncharacterized membrane protein
MKMANASMSKLRDKAEEFMTSSEKGHTNVAMAERWASTVGGGALTIYGLARGLRHRSPGGLAAAAAGGALLYRGVTGHCPAYEAAGVSTAGREAIMIRETVTIDSSRRELYDAWRDFESLPCFMHHLESVRRLDERRSHWRVRMPKGIGIVEWDAEITADRPGELISWRSLPESDIETMGTVRFVAAPGGRGTEVHADIEYRPPAGAAKALVAGLANPFFSQLIREDIRRFKNLMEAGEIPTAEQPAGRPLSAAAGRQPAAEPAVRSRQFMHTEEEL